MRLIFVRHGEPNYEKDCLTENGIIQAKGVAARLHNENISTIYASPMGRAVETASFTAKDHNLKINTLDFMHEIDWGNIPSDDLSSPLPHDGHPWTLGYRLLTENPEYIGSQNWKEHPYFKNNKCLGYYEMISEKFDLFLKEYGLIRKDGLYYEEEQREDTIALFAHGGSGAVMFSHVLNLPFPFVLTSLAYGVCSVSIIEFGSESGHMVIPHLSLFNDMGHIDNLKLEKLHFEK